MKLHRLSSIVLLVVLLFSAQPALPNEKVRNAVRNLAQWLPINNAYQGGDRSVFYVRYMDEKSQWDKIRYCCMIVMDGAPSRNDVLITYWPLPKSENWPEEEEKFLSAFENRSVFYPHYIFSAPRKELPFHAIDYSKLINSFDITRGSLMKGISPFEWQGVLCWGGDYFLVGSKVQSSEGALDSEYRIKSTPLNQLVTEVLKIVVMNGLNHRAFDVSEPARDLAGRGGER